MEPGWGRGSGGAVKGGAAGWAKAKGYEVSCGGFGHFSAGANGYLYEVRYVRKHDGVS